ncbi:MAG: ABC transporter ATP-binding protein [Anaerolineales bacterium]
MIEARGLTKWFGDRCVVDGLTLRVGSGELLALLGPNGAGKTTTIRMLAGILHPTSGGAQVGGFDLLEHPQEVRETVGVLTEQHGLYTRMRAGEYLDFFGSLYGLPAQERRERAARLLARLSLQVDQDRWLAEYSKGMRQRISLVRALLHDPHVLLLDEPTSALDPESAHIVRSLLRELRSEGRAILTCTHNLMEAEELADRIAILRRGRLIAQGTPGQLRSGLRGLPTFEVRLSAPWDGVAEGLPDWIEIVASGDTWFRYRVAEPLETNPLLVRRLVGLGFPILELREVTPSLEEVYLGAVAEGEDRPGDDLRGSES